MIGKDYSKRGPSRRFNSKLLSISIAVLLFVSILTQAGAADTVQKNIAASSTPSEDNGNTSQEVHSNDDDEEFNPQQTVGTNQMIDTNTYGGHTPDATYPISDQGESFSSSSPVGPTSEVDPDIRKLAESMTLRELAGQMTQIQIGMLLDQQGELDMTKVKYWIEEWGVGSFLDTPTNHGGAYLSYSAKRFSKIVNDIQKVALSTGKGIPMIYGLDSVHGANYVDGAILFPQHIGLAATFNTTHAYESGRITAKDTRAAGIPWVFAPILDIAVHKLWPRVYETFDPHVASEMGSATIKGLQGDYKKDRTRVAACMKHFIGYSASRNGQDKSSAWIPDNYLMDYFVPPFQAAVQAGVATAMETYIDVNGQPVVSSHFYLTELLRHRIGFKGMLVSDWQELDRLNTEHRTASSLKDAANMCLKHTSLDMVMVPESESFSKNAVTLVEEGKIDRRRLVDSVAKVLQLKKDIGLFEQPLSDASLISRVGSAMDIAAAKDAARESITVLKNKDSVLPLRSSSIVVTGPAADSIRALSGGWSIKWQGAEDDSWYQDRGETILQGLQNEFGHRTVSYEESVDFDGNPISGSGDAYLASIEDADTVILCLGEKPYAEIVGNINDPDLPWGQLELIRKVTEKVKGTNTKVVLVLVEGRPRGLRDLADKVDAIVMAYLPGPWGGLPIAEILSGAVNPSGRLPMTYPSGPGDMTANYYRAGVDPYKPLFGFGAGISYSTVEYQNLKLSYDLLHTKTYGGSSKNSQDGDIDEADIGGGEDVKAMKRKVRVPRSTIVAQVSVHNKSDRPVKETVFWYITQDYRSDVMPEAFLLKGFQKVNLDAGETKQVKFTITRDALAYHGRNLRKKVEKGGFTLTVNAMRPEAQFVKFQVV
ncbi:hypothetical protein BGX27_003629 [Mortierella sp. AM989]|nr:hypothetical protein BGX27_003629 [Mortierella sp. AM989]